MIKKGKVIVVAAVSATPRPPREGERDGVNYYFMSEEDFRDAIAEGEFLEYEEVYPGRFYGTLRKEVDRITGDGHNIILDLDVNGALHVKDVYGSEALTIFIQPPSLDELRRRLEFRGTETAEVIDVRIDRAAYELGRAPEFDRIVINDRLDTAIDQTRNLIDGFISLQ